MSKENANQDWNKLWNEYNKSLKSWREALESLQKAAFDVQSKYNKAMTKALKDSNGKTMSQFMENWQKSMCDAGINAFKQSTDAGINAFKQSSETGKSKPATKKSINKKSGQEINDLITLGDSLGANTHLLQDASKILNDPNLNNDKSACGKLGMFINQINQSPKLNPEQKTQLITAAKAIKTSLGCK